MFLFADSNRTNILVPVAVISGAASLLSPTLALLRWIQEKSIKSRYRAEMVHSRELFDFIQRCPEMLSTVGTQESAVLERARAELAFSMNKISTLLEISASKAAPPIEVAWPRRLLLLYAPRSWGATILHAVCYLLAVFSALGLVAIGYNDETDTFQWRQYAHAFQNSFFLMPATVWVFLLLLLWYATTTKDKWDKTLPIRTVRGSDSFLNQTPATVREVLARMLFAYGLFDLAVTPMFHGMMKSAPASIRPFLSAIPEPKLWAHILGWAAAVLCPLLAYMWARVEHRMRGKTLRLAFPHNFRVLYPSRNWQEAFPSASLVVFFLYFVLVLSSAYRLLTLAPQFVPSGDTTPLFTGVALGVAPAVLKSVLAIYASYRLGLISYFLRK
jgi:hypothetical protein